MTATVVHLAEPEQGRAHVPVETLEPGQWIVLPSGRARRVLRVDRYETLGLEQAESFNVVYDPGGPGQAWENRAGKKGAVSYYERDEARLGALRRGELVRVR